MQLDHKKVLISILVALSLGGLIYLAYDYYGKSADNITKNNPKELISLETFNQALERPEDNIILNSIVDANGGPVEYAKAVGPYNPMNTNLTEGMARDLYVAAQYSSIDKVVNSPELMAAALDKSLRDYTAAPVNYEIKTSDKMTLSEIRTYGNGVGAMLKYFTIITPALLISSDDIINNKATPRLTKLSELAQKATDLCSMYTRSAIVPLAMVETHKKLLVECDTLANIAIALSQREEDPLKLVIEIPKFANVATEIKTLAKAYDIYLDGKKIFYKAEEPGYNISLNAI